MRKFRSYWRGAFDVRKGERLRALFMGLYFVFILFARNILKPVSDSLFLNKFAIEKLPNLYILIAVVGGVMAYYYTKVVVRTSVRRAATAAVLGSVVFILGFWWLLDGGGGGLLYVFSIFVSLFGIVFVTQGWLVAANIFDSRQAKRLYGLLGLGAIVGAAFGGTFTAFTVEAVGGTNLLPVAALIVLLAYGSLLAAVALAEPHAAPRAPADPGEGEEPAGFTFRDLVTALARYRHLLVIVGIISITFLVEVLVEFQFSKAAKEAHRGEELTAYLGTFNGVYLSGTTFVLQFFFTTLVVARLGVGRTLMVAPASVGIAAAGVLAVPGLLAAASMRLVEASMRYSVNRTAIELLYLPLPTELKNRTKAFVDVFVDRLGRGIAALLLLLLTAFGWTDQWQLPIFVLCRAAAWTLLALRAKKEYLTTVRRRVESRRLDLEGARVTVQDQETLVLLEQVARGTNSRQVIYALSLLDEAPGYNLAPLLSEVVNSPAEEIRAKVYELARGIEFPDLLAHAKLDVESCESNSDDLVREAVGYVLATSADAELLADEFVNHSNCTLAEAALKALSENPELVQSLVTHEWLLEAASSSDPDRRALAAFAVGVRGDEGTGVLHDLLKDPSVRVVSIAAESAGKLGNRSYVNAIVDHLANARLRGPAISALARYGEALSEDFDELLKDPRAPAQIRRQIPRVLGKVAVQGNVEVLEGCLGVPDLSVRAAVLRALSKLRGAAPELTFSSQLVTEQIRTEARFYYQQFASLERFRKSRPGGKATALLTRTIEERLKDTIVRLFRLLGLRYPPKQIYAAYLAVSHRRPEEFSTALDLLDNILDHDLKYVLLPMIDSSPHLLDIGKEVFDVDVPNLETALRQQIHAGDSWLAVCAMATAAEHRMISLTDDISRASASAEPEVAQVAQASLAALA